MTDATFLGTILTALCSAVAVLFGWNMRLQSRISKLQTRESQSRNLILNLKRTLRSLRTYVRLVQGAQRSSERYITTLTTLLTQHTIAIPARPAAPDYTADLLAVLAGLDESKPDPDEDDDSDDDADTGEEDPNA